METLKHSPQIVSALNECVIMVRSVQISVGLGRGAHFETSLLRRLLLRGLLYQLLGRTLYCLGTGVGAEKEVHDISRTTHRAYRKGRYQPWSPHLVIVRQPRIAPRQGLAPPTPRIGVREERLKLSARIFPPRCERIAKLGLLPCRFWPSLNMTTIILGSQWGRSSSGGLLGPHG